MSDNPWGRPRTAGHWSKKHPIATRALTAPLFGEGTRDVQPFFLPLRADKGKSGRLGKCSVFRAKWRRLDQLGHHPVGQRQPGRGEPQAAVFPGEQPLDDEVFEHRAVVGDRIEAEAPVQGGLVDAGGQA